MLPLRACCMRRSLARHDRSDSLTCTAQVRERDASARGPPRRAVASLAWLWQSREFRHQRNLSYRAGSEFLHGVSARTPSSSRSPPQSGSWPSGSGSDFVTGGETEVELPDAEALRCVDGDARARYMRAPPPVRPATTLEDDDVFFPNTSRTAQVPDVDFLRQYQQLHLHSQHAPPPSHAFTGSPFDALRAHHELHHHQQQQRSASAGASDGDLPSASAEELQCTAARPFEEPHADANRSVSSPQSERTAKAKAKGPHRTRAHMTVDDDGDGSDGWAALSDRRAEGGSGSAAAFPSAGSPWAAAPASAAAKVMFLCYLPLLSAA